MALLLWRGRPPINSAVAFLMAITFVERPTLCFSYFFFTNAWLLLATQNWRNNDKPHIWNRTKSFLYIMKMLVLNKAGGPDDIPAQLLYKESVEYDQYWVDKFDLVFTAEDKEDAETQAIIEVKQNLSDYITAYADEEGDK